MSYFKPRVSPHRIPWSQPPNRSQAREENEASPLISEIAVRIEVDEPDSIPGKLASNYTLQILIMEYIAGDENSDMEFDNLSEISEFSHNPSESSAGNAEELLATDEQIQRVLDIVRRNREEDLALHEKVKRSIKMAETAKELLREQRQILRAEREHRERIITFFLYHVQNNNRWSGDPEKMPAKEYERWHTNDGKGWKDMGEWEWEEVWSGPITVAPNGAEIAHSNEEEYLRQTWEREQQRRKEAVATAET
jgi:hypothetical protein